MNDVLLNKKVSIERCLHQISEYRSRPSVIAFENDYLRQDAIAMNLQRACELTIDIANHLVKIKKLGLPQDSKDSFALLNRAGIINTEMMTHLQAMVGFRNILVHQYATLNLAILVTIIEHRLGELLDFANTALKTASQSPISPD